MRFHIQPNKAWKNLKRFHESKFSVGLPKDCGWRVLSQRDGQVVRKLIEYDNRKPSTVVSLLRPSAFFEKCNANPAFMLTYQVLRQL